MDSKGLVATYVLAISADAYKFILIAGMVYCLKTGLVAIHITNVCA